ncbi:MAG TPA: ATP-binding protein, partial [Vicinamibacterales bacterium]|nr:ATP-binding protein [Vicinamibacterales bacterium]
VAVAAPRRAAAKRNGSAAPYTGVPRVRVAVETGTGDDADVLAARVRLLEGFVARAEISDCTQLALQWLAEVLGLMRSICLVRPEGEQSLFVVGSYGVTSAALASYTVSLEDWSNPLVAAFSNRRELFFPAPHSAADRKRRPSTPFEDAPFHAVPIGVSGFPEDAIGMLLVAGSDTLDADFHWFVSVFGQRIDQILRQQALSEGDRKQGRERSLLYSIINAVTDPILLTDTEGRLLIANARALTLFTASEEESEGRRGAVRMNNMLLSSALSSKAIEETGATRRELLLVNPVDGSDLVFELLSTVTEDSRQGSGVVSILRNVTDLRRASEEIEENYRKMRIAEVQARAESDRLNLIIDSVADPIVVTDAAGATSLMNEPAERLFTIPQRASELEQRWVQANDAHFSSFIAGMLVSADQRRVGEIGLVDPHGEPMPVEAIAGKILSEHGELTAVVTILHDRREAIEKALLYEQLKQASDELERKIQAATGDIAQQNELLRRQAIELEQASALKSQFLANMSHEFRTPLNAMLGYTSMLLQGVAGELEPPVKRQLGRIESNGRHLLTIINEILDISRIEAGRMPLQLSTVRIPELVGEVKAELEPIIIRSKLSVTIDIPKDLKAISSDRQKVKQILLNLLSNALKFTHHGGVTIAVRRQPKERTLTLSVTDTGIGIAKADQDRVFEDFRQLDNSPTRAYGGTGLGLSICRRLAQMLDGEITVQSQVGKGSTFTLTLPVKGRK